MTMQFDRNAFNCSALPTSLHTEKHLFFTRIYSDIFTLIFNTNHTFHEHARNEDLIDTFSIIQIYIILLSAPLFILFFRVLHQENGLAAGPADGPVDGPVDGHIDEATSSQANDSHTRHVVEISFSYFKSSSRRVSEKYCAILNGEITHQTTFQLIARVVYLYTLYYILCCLHSMVYIF